MMGKNRENGQDRESQMSFSFEDKTGARPSGIVEGRLPPDQAERLIIRNTLDRNLMVLAGAGAGKTHELVERVISLVRDGGLEVTQLAAITFTRKAAGELRSRIYERLQEELAAHSNEAIARAVERIDQCFIGTIHAFCSRLLRERPLEAGLPFDFKELDERDEPRARRKAWIAYRNQRLRAGDENLKRLLEIHFDSAKLFKFFTRRCQFPELDLKPTSCEEPDLGLAVEKVRAFADLAYPHWTSELDSNPDTLGAILSKARDFLENRGVDTPHDQFAYLSFFDKSKITPTLKRWAADGWAKQAKDHLLPELLEEAVHPAMRSWKQYVYTLIVDIVDGAKEFYDDERRRAGVVTFEDLLVRTSQLLRRNSEVRAYFGRRYKTILVDEFQDTDPVQAQVLMYLTSSDPTEDDWQKVVPREGSLFVVGDEKQSIYRFRRADVETFRFVRRRIEETGGQIVHLNTSFRSLGNLCDWLNGSFREVFSGDDEKHQSDYSSLLRHRPEGRDETCVRVIRHAKGSDVISGDAARIADFIKAASEGSTNLNSAEDGALIEEPVSLGDFMILTRTKRHLNSYAKALEERGIPFDMVGGGELGRSEEVAALTQMFEAVLDPNDPVHLVGYLRGPLVGFGDDELLAIKREIGRLDYRVSGNSEHDEHDEYDEHAGLDDGLKSRLAIAYGRLKKARDALVNKTPSAAFEEVFDELGIIPWSAAAGDRTGSSRAGGLIRLLANVRRWERAGLSWVEIVEELRALLDGDFKIPGITLESGDPEAVQLMNLHQAKGLQANVVFLAAPYDTISSAHPPDFHVSRFNGTPYLSIPVHEDLPNSRWTSRKTLAEPEGWNDDEEAEKQFLAAEENRLRYVAATRARNLLVISTVDEYKKGPWGVLTNFLADVEELEECPPAVLPDPDEGLTELESRLSHKKNGLESISRPSWTAARVSIEGGDGGGDGRGVGSGDGDGDHGGGGGSRGDGESSTVFVGGERRGMDFGSAVHKVLDDVLRGRVQDIPAYVAVVGRDFGLQEEATESVNDAVRGFLDSDTFQEADQATDSFTEVPFAVNRDGPDASVTQGRIDLVYKTTAGWKIVDFKTDSAANDKEVAGLVDRYGGQVAAYAEHWERITGEPVVEKGLWLTALNRYVSID